MRGRGGASLAPRLDANNFFFTTLDGAPVEESECSSITAAAGSRGTRGKGVIYLVFVGTSCSAGVRY